MKINVDWFKAAGIRALKTVAQTAIATIGVNATMGEVNWVMVGSSALLAGILSLLTSIAGLPELENKAPLTPDGSITIDESNPDLYGVFLNFGSKTVEDIAGKEKVVLDVKKETGAMAESGDFAADYEGLH